MHRHYPVFPTETNKTQYRDFVLNLQYILPCGKCRKNLKKNFTKLPLDMKYMHSRDTFSKYLYELHEIVNKMLGKNSGLTYDVIRERYEHFRARCKPPVNKTQKKVHFKNKISIINEKGCTEPLYGKKAKCIIQIVPQEDKKPSFTVDDKCI